MFRYYNASNTPTPISGVFFAMAPTQCYSVEELMRGLSESLRFSSYSGKNFDAFWDSIRVLEGIEERKVILVHRDLPVLDDEELPIYLGLLRDAVVFWRRHVSEHAFEVWFPLADKPLIGKLLQKTSPCPDDE